MKAIHPLLFLLLFPILASRGQAVEVPPPNYIRTVIFTGSEPIDGVPIVPLGESLFLSFDDIIGDEANYYYTIEHFNYDWTPSPLAK